MKKCFSLPVDVAWYMLDVNEKMRPAAFLDIAQELAVLGADDLGFADRQLKDYGIVWVLARMKAHFHRLPGHAEKMTARTWHRGLEGPFFMREFLLLDEKGEVAVSATSTWIVMETATRRALRSEVLGQYVNLEPQCEERAMETSVAKIIPPKGVELSPCTTRRALFSDIDKNGHVNNVRYTIWAMDALPYELVRERPVKELCINFNREVLPGSEVELHTVQDGDSYYVEGRFEGQQVFICKLDF